jgi:hypothetical protein
LCIINTFCKGSRSRLTNVYPIALRTAKMVAGSPVGRTLVRRSKPTNLHDSVVRQAHRSSVIL